ncbi:MAG: hypothetical protein BVN35_17825 [Proteobacteria bacterium ST_bin11]|nr:MAG: hypothetical protein BVN35_17825 [Proteobacteria bacterium ST_bin11]
MSLAFFYLLGQNGTYLASSFYGGIWTTFTIILVALIVSAFKWQAVVAIVLGWSSVAFLPEYRLKTTTKTFNCHKNPATHHHLLFFITEVFAFICVTGVVNIDDSAFWLWLLVAPWHVAYVAIIDGVNRYSHRVKEEDMLARIYYIVYAVILVVSDLYFVLISVIVVDRSQNLAAIAILAVATFIVTYVAENFDAVHRFEFILAGKHVIYSNTQSSKNIPEVAALRPSSSSPPQLPTSSSRAEDAARQSTEDQV